MKKVLKPAEFQCIKNLIGKKFKEIFFAAVSGILSNVDMLVFNFNTENLLSLHVFSFVRIVKNNRILLTSSDMYFNNEYEQLKYEECQSDSIENTLLQKNIDSINQILANRTVIKAYITKLGDIRILFDNNVKIEVIVDAVYKNYECYRLLCSQKGCCYHHIVSYDDNGKAYYEKTVSDDDD